MDYFTYNGDQLYCEKINLTDLASEQNTPLYVYSKKTLLRHLTNFKQAFSEYPTLPCFAVKCNSNLSILSQIFRSGFGADVVSEGELERALLSGVQPESIVYSGVAKFDREIERGIEVGLGSFNVESPFELEQINQIASRLGTVANISLRLNPNIDAKTNPKITTGLYDTKFGISIDSLPEILSRVKELGNINLKGLACHIGSQILNLKPLEEAAASMASIAISLKESGFQLQTINMGGGLGIRYRDETPPELADYAKCLIKGVSKTGLKLVIEPGRVIMGNVGVLLTKVIGVKRTPKRNFIIVDAAMNDLPRPAMYDSFHDIEPTGKKLTGENQIFDIVGPICETADYIGKERRLPVPNPGDYLCVRGCGAYASAMASNYNSRPRAAEILVDEDQFTIIRPREKLENLWLSEVKSLNQDSNSQ